MSVIWRTVPAGSGIARSRNFFEVHTPEGVCSDAVDWSITLQAGGLRVLFPMESLAFLIDLNHPAAQWTWVRLNLLTEMINRNIFWGGGGKGDRCVALTLPSSCIDCLEMMGASNIWIPMDLYGHVMGNLSKLINLTASSLLTLFLITKCIMISTKFTVIKMHQPIN